LSFSVVVLGAGSSSRLGQPKQLLEYRNKPLLQTAVDTAHASAATQVIVAIGGSAPEVRTAVDFGDAAVVDNVHFTTGCSSSIISAMEVIDERCDGFILMLADQPGVTRASVDALAETAAQLPLGVCRYEDGIAHPFWFHRSVFGDLADLHGDKGVWKLIESGRHPVAELTCAGTIPPDVDTWDDYERLIASDQ